MSAGEKMSWGIWYDPDTRDKEGFNDKREQLVLCYVTMNEAMVYTHMVLQPTGGWFPLVALHPYGKPSQQKSALLKVSVQSNKGT